MLFRHLPLLCLLSLSSVSLSQRRLNLCLACQVTSQ